MSIIASIVLWIIYIYLSFWAAYYLFFAIAGHAANKRKTSRSYSVKFLIMLPAYKEDSVIVESAESAVHHNYPQELFDVMVIADSLQATTIEKLKALPVILHEVQFEKSTKSKALNSGLQAIQKKYDAVVILDADNIMVDDFLAKVASRFNRGSFAIQGHRTAKNTNTTLAFLDAISEEVNNHIFRKGHKAVGLSSALIGSAMAFDFRIFSETMAFAEAVGGFDRELELNLIEHGIVIDYIDDAYVLDEKVQKQEVFRNQRRRWISAQLHYFFKYWKVGLRALYQRNYDLFDKVLQGIQVPRIILPSILFIISILSFSVGIHSMKYFWISSFAVSLISILISIPKKYFNKNMIKAIIYIPRAFLSMSLLIFKIKGANKNFIHTTHGEINNP